METFTVLGAREPKKDQIWQSPLILSELERLREEGGRAADFLDRSHSPVLLRDPTHAETLQTFLYLLEALRRMKSEAAIPRETVSKTFERAKAVLESQKIKPKGSRLSWLHGELHRAMSDIHKTRGETWRSAWHLKMASRAEAAETPGVDERQVKALIRMANPSAALGLLDALNKPANTDERAGWLYSECYRLSGDPLAALAYLRPEAAGHEWQRARCEVQITRSLEPMAALVHSRYLRARPRPVTRAWLRRLCEAHLWRLCLPEMADDRRLPRLAS
ncbi:MAG TPA: hypothetical protein VFV50_01925, partial [Bdellovibrionales bacterium]|nr:hypothetical protein [Bdellovibrionales bacterium]